MNDNDLKQDKNIEKAPKDDVVEKDVEESTDESTPDKKAEKIDDKSTEKNKDTEEKKTDDKKEDKDDKGKTLKKKSLKDLEGKWYIVHTYSGHENKVARTLMQRVESMGYKNRIFDAIVPTRETIRIRAGKKETIKEKIFPGYILVNMDLTDESWILVRTTAGVTSFVGAENKPTPIRDDEVAAIIEFVDRDEPIYKAQFSVGEAVKINDGPFSDFLGSVESIDQEKGKIKVLVSIFGRETPVELDFLQVTKI